MAGILGSSAAVASGRLLDRQHRMIVYSSGVAAGVTCSRLANERETGDLTLAGKSYGPSVFRLCRPACIVATLGHVCWVKAHMVTWHGV